MKLVALGDGVGVLLLSKIPTIKLFVFQNNKKGNMFLTYCKGNNIINIARAINEREVFG